MRVDQIINADCLVRLKKMDGDCIDLIVTSPPYAGKRGDDYDTQPISGYNEWFLPISSELLRVLKPTGSFVLNIKEPAVNGERSTYIIELILDMKQQGWIWTEEYIWRKTTSFPGHWNNRFRDGWERCLHFTKGKKFTMNQDAVKIPIGDWADSRFKKKNAKGKLVKKPKEELSKDDRKRRRSKSGSGLEREVGNWYDRDKVNPDNVLEFAPVVNNQKEHSATFPDKLPEWFIKLFTNPGDLVLDPFVGSGTTAFVAKKLGRYYIGIEKNKAYAKQTTKKLNELKKQKKIGDF
jgi:DNA modification methylase